MVAMALVAGLVLATAGSAFEDGATVKERLGGLETLDCDAALPPVSDCIDIPGIPTVEAPPPTVPEVA